MHAQPRIKQKNEIKNMSAVHKTWRTVNVRSRVWTQFIYVLFQLMSTCAEVAQRLNYWPPNRTDEGSSPGVSFSFLFFFFFFFFHTSDKLEIFFDHSILVNGVDPWGVHRFLGGINHENGIYSMGQRHECGLGYIIITIYEVVYKIEWASEWVLSRPPLYSFHCIHE